MVEPSLITWLSALKGPLVLIRSVALILQLNNHRRGLILYHLDREGRGYGNSDKTIAK